MSQDECFICFEVSTQYEKYPSRLKNQLDFFKVCACDGWVHTNCIEIWCNMNETCPICRSKMMYFNFDLQYGMYVVHYFVISINYIYIFIQYLIKLRNFIVFCIIITNILNIVSITLHHFYKNEMMYYDHEYVY